MTTYFSTRRFMTCEEKRAEVLAWIESYVSDLAPLEWDPAQGLPDLLMPTLWADARGLDPEDYAPDVEDVVEQVLNASADQIGTYHAEGSANMVAE